jgi:hypothetical protein
MCDLIFISVRHRDGCVAVEVDPDACTCAPAVNVYSGEQDWTQLGALRGGWTRTDFAQLVTRGNLRESSRHAV